MEPSPQAPSHGAKLSPNLSGVPETLLGILYTRAVDAEASRPILGDRHAARLVAQIDYDWAKLRLLPAKCAVFALRARFLDRWAAEFIDEARQQHEPVTVLHLAAGLDTRALRLQDRCGGNGNDGDGDGGDEGPEVIWVDCDLPDVVGLRRRLAIPPPAAARMRYDLQAADVTEEGWLAGLGLPRGRRTVVVFEGLSMYLQPAQGRALIEQLATYFTAEGNQMCFDCISWVGLMMQRFEPLVAQTGSRFSWAINDPKEFESWHRGLRLRDEVFATDTPENAELPLLVRWACWLGSWIPEVRRAGRYVRFEW